MGTKREFKFFTIFQHEEEAEYLRRMHKKGWKFVKITWLVIYNFEACEPEDVVYQLDYNKDGLAHKEEYVQMFQDCGWEYLLDFAGYSYFRKPASKMNGEEEIFCDDASKAEMMDRVYKGRLWPLLIIFSAILIPQFVLNLAVYHNYYVAIVFGGIIAGYLIVFISFSILRSKYKNNM